VKTVLTLRKLKSSEIPLLEERVYAARFTLKGCGKVKKKRPRPRLGRYNPKSF